MKESSHECGISIKDPKEIFTKHLRLNVLKFVDKDVWPGVQQILSFNPFDVCPFLRMVNL